jgi:hypothetical protein
MMEGNLAPGCMTHALALLSIPGCGFWKIIEFLGKLDCKYF